VQLYRERERRQHQQQYCLRLAAQSYRLHTTIELECPLGNLIVPAACTIQELEVFFFLLGNQRRDVFGKLVGSQSFDAILVSHDKQQLLEVVSADGIG
jgi:hypothetical protein